MTTPLTNAEIDALLSSQQFGHLGCTDESKPYVFPLAYAYHDNVIFGQTTVGAKIEILRKHPKVCFQVQEVTPTSWRSAQCWGHFEEMDFDALEKGEATRIVRILTDHLGAIQEQVGIRIPFVGKDTVSPALVNGRITTLFRIVVTEKTGLERSV
jgi:uncharacterized protein